MTKCVKSSLKHFLGVFLVAVLLFGVAGCSDDSSSGGGGGGGSVIDIDTTPAQSEEIAAPQDEGLIIKNEVVDFANGSLPEAELTQSHVTVGKVYFEYLAFTSATEGTYELWAKTGDAAAQKVTDAKVEIGGEDLVIPSGFSYNSTTCVLTPTYPTQGNSTITNPNPAPTSFLFKAGGSYYCATRKATPKESDKKTLYDKWALSMADPKASDETFSATFQLTQDGILDCVYEETADEVKVPSHIVGYTKTGPFIESGANPLAFLWMKVGENTDLYVFASKASKVAEKGRALGTKEQVALFKSNKFLLLK